MINIVVSHTGEVTGDKGKIIAYEGQQYSELINIAHPLYNGAKYYIEYKYDNTILRDELNAFNRVSIKINQAGYVKCCFIAVDLISGDVIFKSKTWNLIIKEDIKVEESHYPCNSTSHYYKYNGNISSCNCNNDNKFNSYEAFAKLHDELSNEEDIRFNEFQSLVQEISEIKAFIGMTDSVAATLDANTIITSGNYNANAYSSGFPNTGKEYSLNVSYFGNNNILQTAYEKKSSNVYYRSALNITDEEPKWSSWTLLNLQS